MGVIDYCVLTAYLLGILVLGVAFRPARATLGEFFLARRSMGWFPIGLSVMVTVFSATNFTVFPSEVLSQGLYVAIALPVFLLVAWPVTRVFIPFFHSMHLTSAYGYLEFRYGRSVRRLASGLFIFWRVLWMALALYAASRFMAAVTGLGVGSLILSAGAVATFYTALGGMRAVIWTDVGQFFVFLCSVGGALLATAAWADGSQWAAAVARGLFRPARPFDASFFSFDPTIRISFWSGLVGVFVMFLGRYGADQMVVQRYFTARRLRDAQRGFWLNAWSALGALVLLVFLGLVAHLHLAATGELTQAGLSPVARLALFFRSLPTGLTGLMAAGLVAATMSSVDSGIHACSTALVADFLWPDGGAALRETSSRAGRLGPWLVVGFGALSIGLALGLSGVAERMGSLFVLANRVVNALGSPLLGLILCGMFLPGTNRLGVLLGGAAGVVWSGAVVFGVDGLALHYYAVVNLLGTVLACVVCSAAARAMGRDDDASRRQWTWAARRRAGAMGA